MADGTAIEWTHRAGTKGETLNPIRARHRETGRIGWHCTHASDGCRFCYAEKINQGFFNLGTGLDYKPGNEKLVEIFLDDAVLTQPLRWKSPRTIFWCSMTDIFGDFVPDAMLARCFAIMALTPHHTHIVLTKRAGRMREYLKRGDTVRRIYEIVCDLTIELEPGAVLIPFGFDEASAPAGPRVYLDQWPLPNVWLGVSAERREEWIARTAELRETWAAVRFVSVEPLLSDLGEITLRGLDWLIVGGESGPKARPMHPTWAKSIRDQCAAAGVAFFFKQWGAWLPSAGHPTPWRCETVSVLPDGRVREWDDGEGRLIDPDMCSMCRVGKKAAGRSLDGVEHSAFPVARP